MSNAALLDYALKAALSDKTSRLSSARSAGLAFLDSTVITTLVRWSRDAQLSRREAWQSSVARSRQPRLVKLVGLNRALGKTTGPRRAHPCDHHIKRLATVDRVVTQATCSVLPSLAPPAALITVGTTSPRPSNANPTRPATGTGTSSAGPGPA